MEINARASILLLRLAHLQITAFAVGGVDQRSDLKLFEGETEHPVFGDASNAFEAIPTRQRPEAIQVSDGRRRHVYVNVHRLIAVIVGGLCGH